MKSRVFWLFIAWSVILGVCAAVRPLQIDEVIQLVGTSLPHLSSVFGWLHYGSPGSVPVGYAVQWALVRVAGTSNFISRLPSLAAWALAMAAIVRLAVRAGLRGVETLVILSGVTPMLFRYAIEGRPYMPAFCLTVFSTLLLVEFISEPEVRPSWWKLSVYGTSLALAPLVQGSAITVTLAHAVFVLTDRSMRRDRRRQAVFAAIIALSLVLPIAWALLMRGVWATQIAREGYTFALNPRIAYGFLKDIAGGGLVCTGLLFLAGGLALVRANIPQSLKYLLGLTVGITICGAVASDALAGYFISPRQAIYCLGALIVLAAGGWEWARTRVPAAALASLALFAVAALASDVSVVRSKEDWKAASRMMTAAAQQGFCIQPATDLRAPLNLYSFFDPSLEKKRCTASDRKVGLIYSTYTPHGDRDQEASVLTSRGFSPAGVQSAGGSTLERFILQSEAR